MKQLYTFSTIALILFGYIALQPVRAAPKPRAPQPVEMFEMYCYRTGAIYEQTVRWAKLMHLKPMPEQLAKAAAPVVGSGNGYVIRFDKEHKKYLLLGTSKTNSCSVAAMGYNTRKIISIMKSAYKLKLLGKTNVGLQISELFVPGGELGTKAEARSLGVIALIYSKDMGIITLSYTAPKTVREQFQW